MKKLYFLTLSILLVNFTHAQWTQVGQDIDGESAGDQSGYCVSMPDPYTVAIGADLNSENGNASGHARIYSFNGTIWVQKGADIDGEATQDLSGWRVCMPDSNTIAIGADGNDGNGTDAGHVRIYSWNGTAWIQKGTDINGEAPGDLSSSGLSMPDSNTVAIGAWSNDANGSNSGHVRIYTWNGSSWIQKGADIDGEAAQDQFGASVSMPDPNTLAVGAPGKDGIGTDAGHVRIYVWNGSDWIQKGTDIDGEAAGDNSGISISMPDANTIAVGAYFNDGNISGSNVGHVRIYDWNGANWIQKGTDIDGQVADDYYGTSVSMPDANIIAIGAWPNNSTVGHVQIFAWNGSAWIQVGSDIDSESVNDVFGSSVSMPDPNTIAIGAYLNDGNGVDAGQVKVFNNTSVGIKENNLNPEVTVYPNPTTGIINIAFVEFQEIIKIELVSISGQVIEDFTYFNKQHIELTISAPAGIYYLKIAKNNHYQTISKIIKE